MVKVYFLPLYVKIMVKDRFGLSFKAANVFLLKLNHIKSEQSMVRLPPAQFLIKLEQLSKKYLKEHLLAK